MNLITTKFSNSDIRGLFHKHKNQGQLHTSVLRTCLYSFSRLHQVYWFRQFPNLLNWVYWLYSLWCHMTLSKVTVLIKLSHRGLVWCAVKECYIGWNVYHNDAANYWQHMMQFTFLSFYFYGCSMSPVSNWTADHCCCANVCFGY